MQWQQNYGIWNDWYQKLPYSTAYVVIYIYIYWLRNGFSTRTWRLEYNFSHGAGTLSSVLEAGRGVSTETCGLDDVFPPDDLGSGPYTQSIMIFIPWILAAS